MSLDRGIEPCPVRYLRQMDLLFGMAVLKPDFAMRVIPMNDEEALAEIWAVTCPDCGPEDADGIVDHVTAMQTELENLRSEVKRLREVK